MGGGWGWGGKIMILITIVFISFQDNAIDRDSSMYHHLQVTLNARNPYYEHEAVDPESGDNDEQKEDNENEDNENEV